MRILTAIFCLLVFSSYGSAQQIELVGANAQGNPTTICSGLTAITFQESIALTTNEVGGTQVWSFFVNPDAQSWFMSKEDSVGGRTRIDTGNLNPLSSSVGPLVSTGAVAGPNVILRNNNNITFVGAYNIAPCTAAATGCPRQLVYNPSLVLQNTSNLTAGAAMNTAAATSAVPSTVYFLSGDLTLNNELMYAFPFGGGTTTSANAVPVTAGARALSLEGTANIWVGGSTAGTVEVWNQTGPAFITTVTTSCTTVIQSLLVDTGSDSVFVGCAGRISLVRLSTRTEIATTTNVYSGSQQYNAFAFDPTFRKLFIGIYQAGTGVIARYEPSTLTLEAALLQPILNAVQGGSITNHLYLDTAHGQAYLAGVLSNPGSYIMRASYCS